MATAAAPPSVQAEASLLRYENPVLISSTDGKKGKPKKARAPEKDPFKIQQQNALNAKTLGNALTPTENVLNAILPPREWEDGGNLWVQKVSSTPATRLDVIQLQEQLDQRLLQKQARETGIDSVREELYAQCFDELIRQVTIHNRERGLLLLRVRDELRMTAASYQTLYESSIAFGMRKALRAEHTRLELQARIQKLDSENRELEAKGAELASKIQTLEHTEKERAVSAIRQHQTEIAALRERNEELKKELERLLSMPSGIEGASDAAASHD